MKKLAKAMTVAITASLAAAAVRAAKIDWISALYWTNFDTSSRAIF